MATVLWDVKGIILIHCRQKDKSQKHHWGILRRAIVVIEGRNAEKLSTCKEKMLFHHDSAPDHTSIVALAKSVY